MEKMLLETFNDWPEAESWPKGTSLERTQANLLHLISLLSETTYEKYVEEASCFGWSAETKADCLQFATEYNLPVGKIYSALILVIFRNC